MVTMNADYLTCGQCLKEFPLQRITLFIQHKKFDCDDDIEEMKPDPELRCNNCPQGFMTAWALLVHAQLTHNLKIFLENASKTVLKEPDLPGKDTGAFLPAIGSIKSVEASKTCQGEHAEPIPVDQKPAFQTDAKQSVNKESEILVSEGRDKSCNVLAQSTAEHCVKMGSNIVITKNIISNIGKELNQTQTPEKNVKKISRTENKEPVWKNQHTNISQPSNIYQVFPSSVTIVQKSNRTPFTLSKGQIVHTNNMKVLPAVMVNPTSKVSPSTQPDRDEGSALVPQPPYSDGASDDDMNVTKNSQSNLPSDQPFPGLPLRDKQPKLDLSLSENSVLNTADNVDMEIGQTKGPGSSEKQCLEEVGMDVSSQECCDSQDCGVKVIPGSHEHLKKCCNAVVPKKRKRHMELKHMPFAWSSSRYASRKLLHRSITSSSARSTSSQFLNKAASNTIYIDLEPDSMACSGKQGDGNDETSFKVTQSSSAVDITTNETSSQMPIFGTQSKQRSLILKPCSVFSIPLTYAIPTSQTASYVVTPKSKAAKPLVDLKLEPDSGILPSSRMACVTSTCGTDENQTTIALQQANTLTSSVETIRNNAKATGRSRQPLSKPFKCDKCPSAFNQRIHLQKHMSKHTGIKPYKCGECNYATVERSHLKVHIRIHTGEKPFKCTYCEYATAQNSTLKIHLKRHHGGKMFHCRSCDKQFTQKEQLEVHEWEHGSKEIISPQLKTSEDVKFLVHTEDFNQDAGTNQLANQMLDDRLKNNRMFDDSL